MAGHLASRTFIQRLATGADSLLLYIPALFVTEEVSFRGALGLHVQHPDEPGGWISAAFVSVPWGLSHVPATLGQAPLVVLVARSIFICCVIGIPFSLFWRRSGNLSVPALVHALINAVRNALILVPFR